MANIPVQLLAVVICYWQGVPVAAACRRPARNEPCSGSRPLFASRWQNSLWTPQATAVL